MRTFAAQMLVNYLVRGRLRNNVNPGWQDAAPATNR